MINDLKLVFKYLFLRNKFNFIDNLVTSDINIYINKDIIMYLSTHLKLSTPLYLSQLVDIFAYEIVTQITKPQTQGSDPLPTTFTVPLPSTLVTYHFHSFLCTERMFIFTHEHSKSALS